MGGAAGDVEGGFGAHAFHEVDLLRIGEGFVVRGIVGLVHGDARKGAPLVAEEGHDFAGVDPRDGGHALAGAPGREGLHCVPVGVVPGVVCDHDARGLDVGAFKVPEQSVLVAFTGGDPVISDERLGEDEDLSTVGGVGQGFGVADKGSGEDGFTGAIGLGAEGGAGEDRAVLRTSAGSTRTRNGFPYSNGERRGLIRRRGALPVRLGRLTGSITLHRRHLPSLHGHIHGSGQALAIGPLDRDFQCVS